MKKPPMKLRRIRWPDDTYAEVVAASKKIGETVSEFVRTTAVKRARKVNKK